MRTNSIKSFGALLGFSTLTSLAVTAHATGGTTMANVRIADITIQDTTFARVSLASAASNRTPTPIPVCAQAAAASGYSVHYGFDHSTAKGKALLATLTSALLAGKFVSVTGSGACTTMAVPSGGTIALETLELLTVVP